jgi:acyl-CoA dehydrogenase
MGSAGVTQAEVIFEDCRVKASAVLGEVGWGFQTFMKTLDHGRLAIAAAAVGNGKRLVQMSRDYAKVRKAFGKSISEFQAIQHMLADMATEVYAGECMLMDAAWRHDRGEKVPQQCSMVKLFCSEMIGRVADKAVQIHGGMGYMSELPIERIYRDVRAFRIVEGTSEIQRGIIAKHVLQ